MRLVKTSIYLLAIVLLVYFFIQKDVFQHFKLLSVLDFFVSLCAYLILFHLSGLQMSWVIEKSTGREISNLDKLLIPITQNFWGYILPIQGSLIYSFAILKNKYGINLSKTFYVYVFITGLSLWMASIVALTYSIINANYFKAFFFAQIILTPIYLRLTNVFLNLLPKKNSIIIFFRFHLLQLTRVILIHLKDRKLLIKIITCDLIFVFIYALWTYYLSDRLGWSINFMIWFLWSYFLKITLLAKITPGNIGVVQAYTSGFLILYGYSGEIGLTISSIQLLLLVVLIFPIAIINTLINFKYIKLSKLLYKKHIKK